MKLRCAVYARYSSDRQSKCSITDQVRKCREYAEERGWEVLKDHIYSDEAISGATSERAGLQRLMAAASAKAFDIVLIDDTSRLSRKLSDSINLSDRLQFAGVRIVFVSQGIDSDDEQAEVLLATHGIVDSLYIRELGKKTHRGLEGRVLNQLHHGGRIFGYRSVPIEDPERRDQYGRPTIAGARLQVDDEQAKIIRRIFSLYANGLSIKGVTKKLNAERTLSPTPRIGRERSWAPSSVRVILRNERYRGLLTWGKTKKIRNPQTGRRVKKASEKSKWIRVEMPAQRIVSEKLWLAVQERRAYVNRVYGDRGRKGGLMNSRSASSPYIFSGLLRCGVCGANFIIVSGKGKNHKSADYGCPARAFRGTCANARRVDRETLEMELLSKLQRDVLSDEAIDYVLENLEREIGKRFAALGGEMEDMRKRKAVLETELGNLGRAVATGLDSPSVRAEISKREKEIAGLVEKAAGRKKGSVAKQVGDLRKFVKEGVADIRELLAGKHSNPARVRQELARHIDTITLLPEGGAVRYKGSWKLLGYRECAEGQS
ncbi:MAG: recombinase family protein [Candidatus Acidiferrales bacterium]